MISLIKISLISLTLITSILCGMILSNQTKEELKPGRKYFKIINIICLIILMASLDLLALKILTSEIALSIALTSSYLLIITSISLKKSK